MAKSDADLTIWNCWLCYPRLCAGRLDMGHMLDRLDNEDARKSLIQRMDSAAPPLSSIQGGEQR